MSTLQEDFRFVEDKSQSLREAYKDAYLRSPDITEGDLAGQFDKLPITFNVYQNQTSWTAQYPEHIPEDVYLALGLGGEAGEILNECKKKERNDNGILTDKRKSKILDECSDLLFYLSALCLSLGINMSDVANHNQKKLLMRLKSGKIKGSGDDR